MSPTILIVDDCTDIARIIARNLESASYRTITVGNGVAVFAVLERTKPDCIILDLMMPGMSGTEVLHRLRHDPATADIPVILVSARVGHHGTHFRSEADADYCIGKPFTKQMIVTAVRTVLARKVLDIDSQALQIPAPPLDVRPAAAARISH